MKNKPNRHKETNTFKFKPFLERVNDIDFDVFHKITHANEIVSNETETFFYHCLQKWNFLNLSKNYCNFRKEVTDIITLPQLLHRKQHVIDTLLKYLKLKDPLCLQSIFELVIAVVKDLQLDFYIHFPEFLASIIDLLHTKDAEQLEYTFTTLAYLFKFQWRYMIKNVDKIFNILLPLLADTYPVYINNFAAESFAFVVRKVRKKEAFLEIVLETLEKKQDGVIGCGKLLFHVLFGIQGQFHSCAESILTLYLNALKNPVVNHQLLFEVLSIVFDRITHEINPKKCDIFWTVIFKAIDEFSENSLLLILKLIQSVINYKGGQMLQDSLIWTKKLSDMIDKYQSNKMLIEEIANTFVATLLATNIKLLQETSSFLIIKLLSVIERDLLLQITEKLIVYPSFETLVLPLILKKSMLFSVDEKFLQLMVKIIEKKSPPVLSGINFDKWIKFNLDIRSMDSVIFLSKHLDSLKENNIKENALKVLIILPHLTIIQDQLHAKMIENFIFLFKKVLQVNNDQERINFAFLLFMESMVRIMKPNDFHYLLKKHFSLNSDLLSAIILQEYDISILNALDLSLTYLKNSNYIEEYINEATFHKLHQSLAVKLGSSNSAIRLTTSHLYSLFSLVSGLNADIKNTGSKNALELLYLVEKEPVTLHQYRERLLYLRALDFRGTSVNKLNENYRNGPLYCLFGNLYINFSLLWDPLCEIITSYATDECPQFWPIFLSKLKYQNKLEITFNKPFFECNTLSNLINYLFPICEKVDHENYTLLLWKCMSQIVSYCEVKNRDYVDLFISFVKNHIFKSNSEDAITYNIKKREQDVELKNIRDSTTIDGEKEKLTEEQVNEEEEEEDDDDNDDNDDDDDGYNNGNTDGNNEDINRKMKNRKQRNKEKNCTNKEEESKSLPTRSKCVKLLLAMLHFLGKFTNTRSLYREPEIQKIYLDLLCSKNSEIQKAALICIYTYKYKYIMPYKIHLDNIVDEKNLKNELARFQISTDEGSETILQEEHRQNLMPIIMRILLAKMSQKVGLRTGGKAGGLVKRKIILRFLAGVKEEEMMMFVEMAFKPFQNYLPILIVNQKDESKVNLEEMVNDILRNLKLDSVIPPKRLQSIVNLLSVIIEQFGGKMMEKLLPHLFALLICILTQITEILNRSAEVHSKYLIPIRNARNNSINILARFFLHFENYDWSICEINALFKVAVFPWLDKLPIESIHSPTPLLKMMVAWSKNPRYYPLFIKFNKEKKTSLFFLVKLLLFEKTHKSVLQTILDMFEKMLTLQNLEKEETNQMDIDEHKPKSMLSIVSDKIDIIEDDSINYGSAILLPHITNILKYFERNLKNQSKNIINKTELIILSRISEFVSDTKTCNTLLTLVLPILLKKSSDSEETVMQLLTTVTNLIKHVEQPELHLRPIQHLLSQIISIPARKMLILLLDIVVKNNDIMKKNQEIIRNLNAFDQRWIDQPDFQRRLDAFEEIDNLIKTNQVTLEWGVAVIHNCFFFLKTENDLAIRDRSGYCLKSMGVFLIKNFKDSTADRKYLLDETILTMVRFGIRSKNENVKLQSIGFIGHMAIECSEAHPVLRDLNLLTNKQDLEVDFFENMQHLQLYRRAKALHKFCKIAKSVEKAPNSKTLTQFILPLVSSYLCNEQYTNKNSLIDAAIETVGIACRLLPWNQYEIVLRFYLDKLRSCTEFQRQLIRIIVAIIDSFHFDLSKYKEFDEENLKSSKIEPFIVSMSNEKKNVQIKSSQESIANEQLKPSKENMETVNVDESKEIKEIDIEIMDEALNNNNFDNVIEDIEQETTKNIPAAERQTILSPYMAKRLVYNISKGLLPQLHKAIAIRTRYEGNHKVNKKRIDTEQEEEELMRVPIALAMVKLLQKLPHGMLDTHLHGIFMKLCTFLKSRLESVRRTTREILQSIMISLGPNYLHYLLKEMNALLTRGFHVHVLAYTIHAVLVSLKPSFKPEHLTSNLSNILNVCKIDLFGPSSEEKEIIGIVRNTSEAKSTKSFDIYHILGEFINEDSMIDVIIPLKDVLIRTHSHKTVRKIVEALRQLSLGLADNKYIKINQLLIFLHGVTSESIPQLMTENKKEKEANQKKLDSIKKKPDCFLIPDAPKTKMGIKTSAKTSKNTNAHVIIEFGLRLFHILLKREKLSDPQLKSILDSFVPVLNDCLKSQHVKLSALTLQCLNWILKIDLPSVRSLILEISNSMFDILHKYAVAGLSKGENSDLVMAAFKSMSVLVRDVKYFNITADQLKMLLMYAEQDLYDGDKQATAFALLKAIIRRNLMITEMYQVMENVAKLSITSELDNVRKQARTVFYSYLVNYPLGKNLEKHMSFYVTQLGYELQPGRLSALEMIYGIVTSFPLEVLVEYSGLLFLTVGVRLVNDDDPICKKVCAKCIKEVIHRVPQNQRNNLFETIILWLRDNKVIHRRLAVQLCGIFVIVEKDGFESRLEQVLPLLVKLFYNNQTFDDKKYPGRYVKIQKEEHYIHDENIKDLERLKDHLLFQLLQLLLKIFANCAAFFKNKVYQEYIDVFAEHSQSLLAHPHLWVRLAASQVLGFILAALDVDKIIHLINNISECKDNVGFIYSAPIEQLRSLILDSIAQLQPDTQFEDLYDQIIKNLIFITKFIKISNIDERSSIVEDKNTKNDISLVWLVKKLRKCINFEISQTPKSTIVRSSVFKWMAGVISIKEINTLKPVLFHFLSPLVREMATTEESNAPLRQLAKEVATMIKKKISIEDYTRLLSLTQKKLDIRRSERKKIRSQQFVIDPELAVKRKIAKQQKKKISRKRKIEYKSGKKCIRKKIKKEIDLEII